MQQETEMDKKQTLEQSLNLTFPLSYIQKNLKSQTGFKKWDPDIEIAFTSIMDSFLYDMCTLVLSFKKNNPSEEKIIQKHDLCKSLFLDASLHYFIIKPNLLNNKLLTCNADLSLENLSIENSKQKKSKSFMEELEDCTENYDENQDSDYVPEEEDEEEEAEDDDPYVE